MSEISDKSVCCTCLSIDRKLNPLYKVWDGINLLYMLLTHDPEAYKEGFYRDAANLFVCWECNAFIKRVKRFQTQVCNVQKHLKSIAERRNDVNLKTFSSLSIVYSSVEYHFQSDFLTENFIDCGSKELKDENYSDDIPLSAFYSETHSDTESGNVTRDLDYDYLMSVNSNMKLDSSDIFSDNINVLPNHSNLKSDKMKLSDKIDKISDNSNIKINLIIESKSKCGEIKETPKKKAKMKYSQYYSVTTMDVQEMLKSAEKRKIDIKNEVFKCDSCILAFKNDSKLLIHNQELHSKKENSSHCDICHAYIEDLPTHRQSHYYCYNCILCTHKAYTPTDIVKHLKSEHSKICCENKTSSKSDKFSVKPKYPCPECELNFLNKNQRWKHIQKAHREWFKCSSCEKKFAFKNNLERHERIHGGPLPRERCPTCHKMVRTDLLKAHFSRMHTDRQAYTCVECDKHFVSKETYENHLKYARAHATVEVRRHACGACGKRYRSRGELRDHVNYQHKGQAAHKCPVCNKGLSTKRCILRHVRRAHEGIKEGARDKICQLCGKAFRDIKSLIEHERVHSGARPLTCRSCGRAFRQRAALYAHTRRMHTGEQPP